MAFHYWRSLLWESKLSVDMQSFEPSSIRFYQPGIPNEHVNQHLVLVFSYMSQYVHDNPNFLGKKCRLKGLY